MFRALVLTLLLTATIVPISATASVDVCDTYGICVIARTGDDYACAGLGLGYQGVVACADAGDQCVRTMIGFNREEVCATGAIVLP